MQSEFEMSMMEELTFFLRLQIKQLGEDIFISQSKYIKEMLQKNDIENCKSSVIPMSPTCKLLRMSMDYQLTKNYIER